MEELKTQLRNESLVPEGETADTKAWRKLMKALADGNEKYPSATALFTAMHNLVTEGVDKEWIPKDRRHRYCPLKLVDELKAGIFAENSELVNTDSKTLAFIPKSVSATYAIPGLTPRHRVVNCTSI